MFAITPVTAARQNSLHRRQCLMEGDTTRHRSTALAMPLKVGLQVSNAVTLLDRLVVPAGSISTGRAGAVGPLTIPPCV